jgi:putative transposase
VEHYGLRVLKTPVRTPQANAFCERLIGTIRRECLDWLIPFHECHLCGILRAWVTHYNRGRPHAGLGPGIPDAPPTLIRPKPTGHCLPPGGHVIATTVLGGLHMNISWAARPRNHQNTSACCFCGAQGAPFRASV